MLAVKRRLEEMAEGGELESVSIVAMRADVQTGGVGQRGRVWQSPAGGLWMTVAVRDERGVSERSQRGIEAWRSLAVGTEIAEELSARWPRVLVERLRLKWPNDLVCVCEGRLLKCGGILCERIVDGRGAAWWVVGVGINVVNPTGDLQAQVGRGVRSLKELGCEVGDVQIDELFVVLTARVEVALRAERFAEYANRYQSKMWGVGEMGVDASRPGEVCEVVGVDAAGWLMVKSVAGEARSVRQFVWGGEETSDERRAMSDER